MATKIEVRGIKRVHKKLGMPAVKKLRDEIEDDIENGVRSMAKDSSKFAPIDTGALKISIIESVDKQGWAEYIYGSHLPYAQRQEYEHNGNVYDPTPRRAFFRKSIAKHTPLIEKKIINTIRRRLY